MRFRFLLALSFLLVLACAAPAGAAGGGGGSCRGFASGATISILDFCFEGVAHFAEPGTAISVTNDGQATHDFTAVDGSFASGMLVPGDTFELTVEESGIVRYYCTLHGRPDGAGMAGVLVVGDSAPPGARRGEATLAGAAEPAGQDASAALYLFVGALVIAIVAFAVSVGRRAVGLRANRRVGDR